MCLTLGLELQGHWLCKTANLVMQAHFKTLLTWCWLIPPTGKRESHDQGPKSRSKEVHTTHCEAMVQAVIYSITTISYDWAKKSMLPIGNRALTVPSGPRLSRLWTATTPHPLPLVHYFGPNSVTFLMDLALMSSQSIHGSSNQKDGP